MNTLDAIILVLGFFTGSFLNLYIDRLSRGIRANTLNVPWLSCEKPRKLYDRIPVLGYIFSIVKCSVHISIRNPALEIIVAFISFLLFKQYGFSIEFFAKILFMLLLILVSFIDLEHKIVPDILTIGGLSAGFIFAFFRRPLFFYQDAIYGIFAFGGTLLAITFCCKLLIKQEIIGWDDIKLLCMIGAFCGFKGAVFSFLAGSLFGALTGIPIMIIKGKDINYTIPFGPFLSLGALIFIFYGDGFVQIFINVIQGR